MKKLLFILLLIIPFIGFGQGFEKYFGETNHQYMGGFVQQTTDGGYIMSGTSLDNISSYNRDLLLIKTTPQGDSSWVKKFTWGVSSNEWGESVQQTTDGGYIVCGYTNMDTTHNDIYLIKTDGSGIEQWSQTFGGPNNDRGYSVQQTTDGGYIISGIKKLSGVWNYDLYLIKTDGNGNQQWSQTFGGGNSYGSSSVKQTNDGGYIICGDSTNYIYIIKTNTTGNQQWSQIIGDGFNSYDGYSIQQTTDGGYIICGVINDTLGYSDIYLTKIDSSGNQQWDQTFGGGITWEEGSSVQQTTDGGYIIGGRERLLWGSFSDSSKVYIIKTDGNGNQQWDQRFGGSNPNWGSVVQQTTDGGYIICGMTEIIHEQDYDIYLIKTDGNGNVTSTFNIPTPSSNRKLEKVVDVLGREIKPRTNTLFIEIYDDGSTEKKIVVE